jgi:dihydroxyacetone kinase-like protein
VLHIVKNYTGDVMNFEAAAEELQEDGLKVSTVIVADDVSIAKGSATAGRRGVGGTVFVEKIAGAAAQRGDSLEEVTRIAAEAASRVRSMGVALSAGSLFHSPEPTFQLPEGEIEVGIGIHGEAGRFRSAFLSSKETVAALLGPIFEEIDGKEPLLVMVNGMGATTLPELHIAFADACDWIAARGRQVGASLVGNYVTSTDMAGFSISVLPLTEEFAELWRAPVATPALQGVA